MLRVGQAVVDAITRRVSDRLIFRIIERLIRRTAGNREGERETLPYGAPVLAIQPRLIHHDRNGARPIQAKRSVAHLVEQVQIFDGSVIDAVSGANTALSRSAKDLGQNTVGEARRISQPQTRSEIVVSRRRQGARDAWIAGHYPIQRRSRELRGLLARYNGFDLALRVVPRHAHFPAYSEVQSQVRFHLPGILNVSAAITGAGVQELHAALGIAAQASGGA